jgi:2-succinyl-5-enolpyruvyl-6-hydroxy-3-cyclohexene-1-carboxylate synthase
MSSSSLDFRNTNTLWCSVLVETLARLGVRQAVTSPGSRCAPLTFAFARHPQIEAIPVLDERSAAFFALGLAKQQHRPVVLVCTSGTAAANYLPAIVEAHESGVPLLVLTADRPPELRDCGSGQTIDQQKIYGSFVQFYHELARARGETRAIALPAADRGSRLSAHAATRSRAGAFELSLPRSVGAGER